MKPVTSNLACSWGLLRPIIKSHYNRKWVWPWTRAASRNLGFPFNISGTAEASDFKFGTQLRFAKAHHKITPRGKSVGGLGLVGELPKILGFPYNISATTGSSDFKFGKQLRFAKAHHKITHRRKGGHGPGLGELSKISGFLSIFIQWLSSNLVHCLGLPRPTIKPHPEEKCTLACACLLYTSPSPRD